MWNPDLEATELVCSSWADVERASFFRDFIQPHLTQDNLNSVLLVVATASVLSFLQYASILFVRRCRSARSLFFESVQAGAPFYSSGESPPCQVEMRKGSRLVGFGIRVGDWIVTPQHVADSSDNVWGGTSMFTFENYSTLCTDAVAIRIPANWNDVRKASVGALCKNLIVRCVGPMGEWSCGRLAEADLWGGLDYFGSTDHGFSGAAYASGNTVYGMHCGGSGPNKPNFGWSLSFLSCFVDDLAEEQRTPVYEEPSVREVTTQAGKRKIKKDQGRFVRYTQEPTPVSVGRHVDSSIVDDVAANADNWFKDLGYEAALVESITKKVMNELSGNGLGPLRGASTVSAVASPTSKSSEEKAPSPAADAQLPSTAQQSSPSPQLRQTSTVTTVPEKLSKRMKKEFQAAQVEQLAWLRETLTQRFGFPVAALDTTGWDLQRLQSHVFVLQALEAQSRGKVLSCTPASCPATDQSQQGASKSEPSTGR
ncbi:hypothetical protein 1 [Beihai sobemo-like virus 26]|uniref:hypothetical protein 1 n=1 Tax=Beihai sobemo-like virus 26 TaxID=1922698 RepID=UPI000909CD58|nr:hypothetical protein 1 [Beihai sobemo-like virus 26]APG75671.1 hypothetical protein 1 [Beihai sobemo-like virus 26]